MGYDDEVKGYRVLSKNRTLTSIYYVTIMKNVKEEYHDRKGRKKQKKT